MYERILVATGGSPWSDAAVDYAIAFATRTGAELHILTVLLADLGAYASPDMMGGSELVVDIIERDGQVLLEQTAARATSAGVVHATHYAWGNIPATILRTAAEECCDLIVLGSRGLTGLKRLVLGSISNAVAAKARQPVLVIKQPPAVMPEARLWRRVLVPIGGSPWSDSAVDYALTLAQDQQLEVCLLHVEREPPGRGEDPAAAEGKNVLAMAEMRAAAAGVTYQARLAYRDIVTEILETASSQQCDAIILGSRGLTGWKRLMLGSISNAVATKALQPVLIVKRFLGM